MPSPRYRHQGLTDGPTEEGMIILRYDLRTSLAELRNTRALVSLSGLCLEDAMSWTRQITVVRKAFFTATMWCMARGLDSTCADYLLWFLRR